MSPSDSAASRRARLVALCGALPESRAEGERHIGFKVRARTFAYYLDDHHGDGRVALCCKVDPTDRDTLLAMDPERFHVPAYLGPRGWIALRLDTPDVDWPEAERLVRTSYRLIAPRRLAAAAG